MRQIQKKEIELLAPAGSYETFLAVIRAGADAVYLGGSRFGARAYADNFGEEELCAAIDYAHRQGVKVYLAVNTLMKEHELRGELYSYLLPYYRQGLDAVIVQDLGAIALIREAFPQLAIHTSTQMTVAGAAGAAYMKTLGADRVVTAREMSLAEIRKLHRRVDVEIESFVHGALCYCYSGQCLLSSMLGGRSGNRGRCAQPCRLPYEVFDERMRPVKSRGAYVLSPKDLCTIASIPDLAEAGVHSFKIEGRMKRAEYAAGVVSVYRRYVDGYLDELNRARKAGYDEKTARKAAKEHYNAAPEDMQRLLDMGNRSGFSDGYYYRHNGPGMITFGKPGHEKANEALWREIRTAYVEGDGAQSKEKINGILKLKKDFPAILEVSDGTCRVSVTGDAVQAAERQPLTEEKIAACLQKTGNTPYTFERLSIETDGPVFLPVQALNRLRRDALTRLAEQQLASYRRGDAGWPKEENTAAGRSADTENTAVAGNPAAGRLNVAVSVENREQLAPVLARAYVDEIYLDSSCYQRKRLTEQLREDVCRIHTAGKKAYYILPAVFRSGTEEFYDRIAAGISEAGTDGFVVKSFDALWFVRQRFGEKMPLILDHGIYIWNSAAKAQVRKEGILRDTAPLELNRRELFARDNRDSELVVYGYLPLMTSAQCVHANTSACDKNGTVLFLKDRYGKYFPVKNHCGECYNTLYNSAPLMLFGALQDAKEMGMRGIRLSFTTEREDAEEEILRLYERTVSEGKPLSGYLQAGSYTNGHYKRGVE